MREGRRGTALCLLRRGPAPSEQEMESRLQEHRQELERLDQTRSLDKEKLLHEAKLKREAAQVCPQLEPPWLRGHLPSSFFGQVETQVMVERDQHSQRVEFLSSLKELGVDMTRYLLSLRPEFVPEKEVIVAPATRTVPRHL